MDFAIFRAKADSVAGRSRGEFAGARQHDLKETFGAHFAHGKRFRRTFMGQCFGGQAAQEELRFDRAWLEETDGPATPLGGFDRVRAENAEGIGVAGHKKRIDAIAQRIGDGGLGNGRTWVRHESILTEERGRTNGVRGMVSRVERGTWISDITDQISGSEEVPSGCRLSACSLCPKLVLLAPRLSCAVPSPRTLLGYG